MPTPTDTIWDLSPHTAAKHEILKHYLGSWFPILARHHGKIVYIDDFCGPGRYTGGEPGSPILALNVARSHASPYITEVFFLFIDEDEARINHLKFEISKLDLPAKRVLSMRFIRRNDC